MRNLAALTLLTPLPGRPDGRVAVVVGGVGGERALADETGLDRPLQVMMLHAQSS